jgi:hypothetical protein
MPTVPDNWPFEDPPNVAVITTRAVLEGAAIVLVSHDEDDGGWQFLPDGPLVEADGRVVALRSIWELDPTIAALADLPLGWQASRSLPGDPWRRNPHR